MQRSSMHTLLRDILAIAIGYSRDKLTKTP